MARRRQGRDEGGRRRAGVPVQPVLSIAAASTDLVEARSCERRSGGTRLRIRHLRREDGAFIEPSRRNQWQPLASSMSGSSSSRRCTPSRTRSLSSRGRPGLPCSDYGALPRPTGSCPRISAPPSPVTLARPARELDISASPTENTVDSYLNRGCVLAPHPTRHSWPPSGRHPPRSSGLTARHALLPHACLAT